MQTSIHANIDRQSLRSRDLRFTKHAQQRSIQRAIPERCVPLLVAYGKAEHDGRGGIKYVMTDGAIEAIECVVGHTAKLERLRGAYVVLSATENAVVTVGHHFKGRA